MPLVYLLLAVTGLLVLFAVVESGHKDVFWNRIAGFGNILSGNILTEMEYLGRTALIEIVDVAPSIQVYPESYVIGIGLGGQRRFEIGLRARCRINGPTWLEISWRAVGGIYIWGFGTSEFQTGVEDNKFRTAIPKSLESDYCYAFWLSSPKLPQGWLKSKWGSMLYIEALLGQSQLTFLRSSLLLGGIGRPLILLGLLPRLCCEAVGSSNLLSRFGDDLRSLLGSTLHFPVLEIKDYRGSRSSNENSGSKPRTDFLRPTHGLLFWFSFWGEILASLVLFVHGIWRNVSFRENLSRYFLCILSMSLAVIMVIHAVVRLCSS